MPSQYILAATLKLYVTKFQPYQNNTSVVLSVGASYPQNPNQPYPSFWAESSLDWQNQPNVYYGLALSTVIAANQTVAVDVTQYARNVAQGTLNNGLIIYENGPGSVVFASKESGGNAPRLEIYLNRISSVTGTGGLAGGGTNGDLVLSIADSGVATPKLADGAVTSQKIAPGAVGTVQLAANAVTTANIAPAAVGTTQIATESVTSNKIAPGAVGSVQLAFSAVNTNQLSDGAVTSAKLGPAAVGTSQIANESVTSNKIASGGVGTSQLAAAAVNTSQLSNGAVTSAKIAPGAVGATEIANQSITTAHLGTGAVTADRIGAAQVVKGLNNLTDNVTLAAGDNVSITQSGNTLTISAGQSFPGAGGPSLNALK